MRAGVYAYTKKRYNPRPRWAGALLGLAVLVLAGAALALFWSRRDGDAGWQRAVSAEGGYSVLLPAPARAQVNPIATEAGPITLHVLIAERGDEAFTASWADYPPAVLASDPEAVLDGARDGAAASVGGMVAEEIPIGLAGGYRGRQLRIESRVRASAITVRLYLVGRRLYQLLYVADGEGDAAARDRFLASFELRPPAGRPAGR